MAGDAFGYTMLAQQRVFCLLVVIKCNFFPIPIGMAIFALGTKRAFVLVVFLVAGDAKHWRIFVRFFQMAIFALYVDVFAR